MQSDTTEKPEAADAQRLSLPRIRCLSKAEAAAYLGIGVTLLESLDVPFVKFGRRLVYDVFDLDRWLEEHKRRGRAGKEAFQKWPVKPESTGAETPGTGGSTLYYRTADAYAKALGLTTGRKSKR